MSYYRQYVLNLLMLLLLLCASGYHLIIEVAASIHGNPLVYSLWVFVWVMTVATGIEVVKDAWRHERELWLAEVMPPILLD